MDYEEIRATGQPWGYWLRVMPDGPPLLDEDGSRWADVRHCFWEKRLGMPRARDTVRDEQLECMLGVLLARSHRMLPATATAHDMLEGSLLFYRFYLHWLCAQGLLGSADGEAFSARLTVEGDAVIRMLAATRPLALANEPVQPTAYDLLRAIEGIVGDASARMLGAEAFARTLPQAFVREQVGGTAAIALVMLESRGPIPFQRTVWSQAFADERSRDAFYLWLCNHADRWDAWALIAWQQGGSVLTRHLLAMLATDQCAQGEGEVPFRHYK